MLHITVTACHTHGSWLSTGLANTYAGWQRPRSCSRPSERMIVPVGKYCFNFIDRHIAKHKLYTTTPRGAAPADNLQTIYTSRRLA